MTLPEMASAVADEQRALTPDAIWQQILQHLEAEKERIIEEISAYPAPIPACDTHFNSLLEERVAILQELGHVKGILKQSLTVSEHVELLREFIVSSRYFDGEAEGEIRREGSFQRLT